MSFFCNRLNFIPDSNLVKGFILKMNAQGTIIWENMVSDLAGKYGVSDLSLDLNKIYVIGFREVNPEKFDEYAGIFDIGWYCVDLVNFLF